MKRYMVGGMLATAAAALVLAVALPVRAAMDEPSAPTPTAEKPTALHYNGTIERIDQSAQTIVVKGTMTSRTFKVAADAEIVLKDKPQAGLSELKVGDRVDVFYSKEGNSLLAHRIELSAAKDTDTGR